MATAEKYALTWDLESLLPHPETDTFADVFAKFRRDVSQLAEQSAELPSVDDESSHVAAWVEFLATYESVVERASDLESFIACHAAADAENKLFQQQEAQLSALEPLKQQIATNVEFALRDATDDTLAAFIKSDERLERIEFFLRERRRNAEVRLPKEQELLAAELAVDGIHGWGRLYDRISGELRVEVMERGELVKKSVSQVQFDSPQRAVRENNFFASNRAWDRIADTCADALNHIAGTRLTAYRRLGIDHLEVPCRLNRMRQATLEAMWSAVSNRKSCLLDYMNKKAELFGLSKLAWYDQAAPFPTGSSAASEIAYEDACDLIIKTFHGFSQELGEFAQQAIENRWVEVENRSGKRQGGFCTDFAGQKQSRIFMTFTNTADSMSTLAHELGHAYHSYVLRDEPRFLQDYPMNLAETASTFAEAVLAEERLRKSESEAEQIEILDNMLSDSIAFLMNIHARYIFEDSFHRARADGELSATRLSEMMVAAQKEAYLDGLSEDGWNPNFWISKLHFYISGWPFYNFPYTFGYLLSLGVYALGIEGGADFPQQYRQLLIATGCKDAEEAVQSTLGYDLT
ncbi:MAG: M3 family oligoendopeptidase, partial [Planctomycetes bacterium]|nr:M3 family oligoendopeptidase [Planctomycetota bacterium]